jgi:hypothetical protein
MDGIIFGTLELKIPDLTKKIEVMELKGELGILSEEEVRVWKEDCEQLWQLLKSKDCIEFQKSKAKWLKEGGCKYKLFSCLC